jgi:hypothetical protein
MMGGMGEMGGMHGSMGDHPCMEPEDLDDGGMRDDGGHMGD